MYLHKSRFWTYIVLAFVVGCMTRCTVAVNDKDSKFTRPQAPALVIPPDRAKEAAELYSTVYKASIEKGRGSWAREDAEAAVASVYGQPSR